MGTLLAERRILLAAHGRCQPHATVLVDHGKAEKAWKEWQRSREPNFEDAPWNRRTGI
jgi:hypothetical protein